MTNKKNDVAVAQQGETKMEQKFNVWNITYKKLVQAFIESGEKTEFSFKSNHYFDSDFVNKENENIHIDGVQKVLAFLKKNNALKVVKVEHIPSEDGTREIYQITIKDFNIKAEIEGKYGKYKLFAKQYGQLKLA